MADCLLFFNTIAYQQKKVNTNLLRSFETDIPYQQLNSTLTNIWYQKNNLIRSVITLKIDGSFSGFNARGDKMQRRGFK